MSSAERSRRYRQRRKLRDAVTVDAVTRVTAALDALCDVAESVTAAELAEMLNPIEALGVGDDAELASTWLGALEEVLAARRAGG